MLSIIEDNQKMSVSFEIFDLVLQLVVYSRLEEVLVLVVLWLDLHPSLLFVLPELALLLLAQSLVQLDGLDVDLLVLELGVLYPGGGGRAEEHAEVGPEFRVGDDERDELVVVLGLLDECLEAFYLRLVILALVLLVPEVVHEGSDYIFGDILLIPLDLRSVPADFAAEED